MGSTCKQTQQKASPRDCEHAAERHRDCGHDQYSGANLDLSDADGSTVFMPNGEIIPLLTGEDVAAFYNGINRRGLAVGDKIPTGDPNFRPHIVPDPN